MISQAMISSPVATSYIIIFAPIAASSSDANTDAIVYKVKPPPRRSAAHCTG